MPHLASQVRVDREHERLDKEPAIQGHSVEVYGLRFVIYGSLPRLRVA